MQQKSLIMSMPHYANERTPVPLVEPVPYYPNERHH